MGLINARMMEHVQKLLVFFKFYLSDLTLGITNVRHFMLHGHLYRKIFYGSYYMFPISQQILRYIHTTGRSTITQFVPQDTINLLKPTGHVMHQQFNIQQLYVLPTLYLSENKQRLVPLIS